MFRNSEEQPSVRFYTDRLFYLALIPAGVGVLLPHSVSWPLFKVIFWATVEEAIFRWGLQGVLEARVPALRSLRCPTARHASPWRFRLTQWVCAAISPANILVSALFACAHLAAHTPLWAAATLFPSLVLGALYSRYRRVLPCAIAHAVYNAVLFW